MNIVIAPDSFKGSLTSNQAAQIMEAAILDIYPNYTVTQKPMADGGEGTIQSLLTSVDGKEIPVECTGATGEQIQTTYAVIDGDTAIIEYAKIAGLTEVPVDQRNPDFTTSYGLGEVMLAAIERGCQRIVVGLGGSATMDGGLGMLQALGVQAYDEKGNKVGPYGKELTKVTDISFENLSSKVADVHIKVACDVDNPLCGRLGASRIYGPQKGATEQQIKTYDQALNNFSDIIEEKMHRRYKNGSGAGAAGGIGFALHALGAELVSGAELLGEAIHIEAAITEADLVFTGEGESNLQTLSGKAPGYVAACGQKHNVPVILISGSLVGDLEPLRQNFSGCFSITNKPMSLEASMKDAPQLLYEQTKQIIHFVTSLKTRHEGQSKEQHS